MGMHLKSCLLLVTGMVLVWGAGVVFCDDVPIGGGDKIPSFPSAEDLWGEIRQVDINGVASRMLSFGANKPIAAILDFYQQELPKRGWTFGERWDVLNVEYFKKGNIFLYIAGSETLRGYDPTFTKYLVVLSKTEVHLCASVAYMMGPNFKETPGRDLKVVPRYPGSVRAANIVREDDKEAFYIYVVREDTKKIEEFYNAALIPMGWKLVKRFSVPRTCIDETFKATALRYKRGGNDDLNVYISYCAESRANVVIISYNYSFNYAVWPLQAEQTW